MIYTYGVEYIKPHLIWNFSTSRLGFFMNLLNKFLVILESYFLQFCKRFQKYYPNLRKGRCIISITRLLLSKSINRYIHRNIYSLKVYKHNNINRSYNFVWVKTNMYSQTKNNFSQPIVWKKIEISIHSLKHSFICRFMRKWKVCITLFQAKCMNNTGSWEIGVGNL